MCVHLMGKSVTANLYLIGLTLSLGLAGCSGGSDNTNTPSASAARTLSQGTTSAVLTLDSLPSAQPLVKQELTSFKWSNNVPLEVCTAASSYNPSVTTDGEGNALAIWLQVSEDFTTNSIWSARYQKRIDMWEPPTLLFTAANLDISQVVSDAQGNAYFVWKDETSVWAGRYRFAGNAFDSPMQIGSSKTRLTSPAIAVTERGHVVAAWTNRSRESDLIQFADQIASASFDPDTNQWSAPEVLYDVTRNSLVTAPQAAIDKDGNTIIVWTDALLDEPESTLYSALYSVQGQRWNAPTRVQAPRVASNPRVAMDEQGTATIIWQGWETGGDPTVLYSSRLPLGSEKWGAPVAIAVAPSIIGAEGAVTDRFGNVFIAYSQASELHGSHYPRVQRYDVAARRWDAPVGFGDAEIGIVHGITVAKTGDAIVTWHQSRDSEGFEVNYPGLADATAARYDAETGLWSTPQRLQRENRFTANADVAFDNAGNAIAVWPQYTGNNQGTAGPFSTAIYANRMAR